MKQVIQRIGEWWMEHSFRCGMAFVLGVCVTPIIQTAKARWYPKPITAAPVGRYSLQVKETMFIRLDTATGKIEAFTMVGGKWQNLELAPAVDTTPVVR